MRVLKLSVTGLRALTKGDFDFLPGMNLLVGVNGVGKTSILDALRICLSRILPEITQSKSSKIDFVKGDVKEGFETLLISCDFEVGQRELKWSYSFNKTESKVLSSKPEESERSLSKHRAARLREQRNETVDLSATESFTPGLLELFPDGRNSQPQLLAVYYSTKRAFFINSAKGAQAAGGVAAAFADSLETDREYNLRALTYWYKAQEELAKEGNEISNKHIAVLNNAASRMMPGFTELSVSGEGDKELKFFIKKAGTKLSIEQLSDGERGILSVVLDLAKRLSQANPTLENPLNAVAIILIDELDLHLHPKWQRTIVENLTRTFPNCQFIATTHSPQIIPTVAPERISLFKDNEIIRPEKSLGMDSNWILRHIMEADDRPEGSKEAIAHVEELINEGDFEQARAKIIDYRDAGYDLPEWSILDARMARLELIDDEEFDEQL
jgi:predicted ATP-binding protein involved in virulence